MTEILLLGVIGKILIFLVQKFSGMEIKWKLLRDWLNCQLCLGVWVFSFLSLILRVYLFEDLFQVVPVVSAIITGSVMSFVVFLITLGWNEYFGRIIVE